MVDTVTIEGIIRNGKVYISKTSLINFLEKELDAALFNEMIPEFYYIKTFISRLKELNFRNEEVKSFSDIIKDLFGRRG